MKSSAFDSLQAAFEAAANPEKAAVMKAYMKDHFDYLGLQKPVRNEAQKVFIEHVRSLQWDEIRREVLDLWQSPYREYQYTGMDLLLRVKKKWGPDAFDLFTLLIREKSWWDTVDCIAGRMIGGVVEKDPAAYRDRLLDFAESDNIWLNRTAIIHQLFYKEKTDTGLFEEFFRSCGRKKEFFIQKAIGWALRQYSSTDADYVRHFAERYSLKGLARREALRKIES
ncbi:MAG: hypothetical protein RL021_806 [Bacteroidota bacterium]